MLAPARLATAMLIAEMERDQSVYSLKGIESGDIPTPHKGAFYLSSDSARFPAETLALGLLADFDALRRTHLNLHSTRAFGVVDRYRSWGHWRFISAQLALSSFYVRCSISEDVTERALADVWTLMPLPYQRDPWASEEDLAAPYAAHYRGDAKCDIGGVEVTVCSPWIAKQWSDVEELTRFLKDLHDRLWTSTYIICSAFGFQKYSGQRGTWPW